MSNGKPPIIKPNQGAPQMVLDPKILKDAIDMKCIKLLPKMDEKTGRPLESGEVFECAGEIFVDAYRLKYVSPIMSPVGKQTVGNIMIGKLCVACGKLFSPDEWMKDKDAKEKAAEEVNKTKESKIIKP